MTSKLKVDEIVNSTDTGSPSFPYGVTFAGAVTGTTGVFSANSSDAALRITQTGAGNALVVEDSANPDATPFVVDAGGRVISGNTVAISDSLSPPRVQLHAVTNFADSRYGAFNWEANANSASIVFAKSRSTIPGTYAIASSGDLMGAINFEADDGVQFRRAAQITASVDGTPGTNDMPGRLVFSTAADGASSPTERMRINSSGNVGIGTTSPGVRLHVVADNPTRGIIGQFSNTASSGQTGAQIHLSQSGIADWVIGQPAGVSAIAFWRSRNTGADGAEYMRIDSTGNVGIGTSSPSTKLTVAGDVIGNVLSGNRPNSGAVTSAGLGVMIDGVIQGQIVSPAASSLAIYTGGNERMRIDSSGNLLVGTTSAEGAGVTLRADNCVQNSATSSTTLWSFRYNGTEVGKISRTTTATTYATSSDYRLKENVQPMQNALATVAQLKPCTYTWKADGSDGQGFIAHELQAVVPDAVTGEKDAVDGEGKPVYQGVDTSFLVATLTAALQELNAKVEAQAQEIAALKGA